MKYILIFHANLNYSYLTSDKYEFVLRKSYEMVIDTMREHFPDVQYVFEASGFTIDQMARLTPDVLEKLKNAIKSGQCEFMGSPYAHPMLPNFPQEDGLWSIVFSNECYEKKLEITPNHKEGWFNTGMSLANLWKYKEAIVCYDKALAIDPDYEEVEFYKILSLNNLKKSKERRDDVEK